MTDRPYGYAPAPMLFPNGYASWGRRVVAYLWDFLYMLPPLAVLIPGMICAIAGAAMTEDTGNDAAGITLIVIGVVLALAATVWYVWRAINNYVLRQGRTGYTWGKARTGIRVVGEADGQPAGAWFALARLVLHSVINNACYIDYLWPLWDQKNQTLTDKILGTVVVNDAAGSIEPGHQG